MTLPKPAFSADEALDFGGRVLPVLRERGKHICAHAWPPGDDVEAVVIVARGQAAKMLRDFARDVVPPCQDDDAAPE